MAGGADVPGWMRPLVDRIDGSALPEWVRHATEKPPSDARRSAVLMLLAGGDDDVPPGGRPLDGAGLARAGSVGGAGDADAGPDVLLTARAATLRAHAGQPAFPGGALEPGEAPVAGALREAAEETALDPGSVIPAAALPDLYLRPSGYLVRPVLAYWRTPGPVYAVDPAETASVARVPVRELADPANRGSVVLRPQTHGGVRREIRSPAFAVADMVVWGFTAGLIDLLLEWGGWAQPWDRRRELRPYGMDG